MKGSEVGKTIKLHRLNQNRTLEETAQGICSISYLSKIENGLTKSSDEIVQLLFNRLNIPVETLEEELDEGVLEQELQEWYTVILQRETDQATEQYVKLKQKLSTLSTPSTLSLFKLYEVRYHLHMRHLSEVPVLMDRLERMQDLFEEKHHYYYMKFYGLYHHVQERYQEAQQYYKKALAIGYQNTLSDSERADLYFVTAINESSLQNVTLALHYARLALNLYTVQFDFKRSGDCQILLGICYKRTRQFEQADQCFQLAVKAAGNLQSSYLKGIAYHNLGSLHAALSHHEKAIDYFQKSLIYKENKNSKGKLTSIASIVESLYALGDQGRALEWIDRGLMMINQQEDFQILRYYFQVYKYRVLEDLISLEHYLRETVIPYFIDNENQFYIGLYCELLAECLQKHKRYKDACYYLTLANESHKKLSIT
ncbi:MULTISPECIES: helix-turn-helix domain-containing protein [Pontibacillus]|uniref:Tetratricopeptide repeat protein n=1 Tax=Pontibacillus chungwhensis TaxID=265426 RepID=A0ABY8V234_9BACI|nr:MULTISPECIES: tetratricopeptide repeat protein [Pontibacillus]MCD5322394.1 tetratricopeptide repeat protein [Pontibacillus sp. HN14]WIF99680.1 tetratricopeptide repeat protein [Pontibacillus chungwhensis]